MKKILTIILLLSYTLQGMAVDNKVQLECIYHLTYQVDTITKRSNNAMMVLRLNEEKSLFYAQAEFEFDSLSQNSTGMESYYAIRDTIKAKYGGITAHYYVLKDFGKQQLDFLETIPRRSKYTEPLPSFNWKITEEQKTIGEHQCQKATCVFGGRTYEVWFAPDIPISDGPWKFHGLPGLILEAYDTQHHYEFLFQGMRPCAGKIEIPVEKYSKTTKKDFLRIKQLSIDDPNAMLEIMSAEIGAKVTQRAPKRWSYATMERVESVGK